MVLICVTLIINSVGHLFLCLLASCACVLGKMSDQFFSFFNRLVCFFAVKLCELFMCF